MKKIILTILLSLSSTYYYGQKKINFTEGEATYNVTTGTKNTKDLLSGQEKNDGFLNKIFETIFSEKSAKLILKFKGDKRLSAPEIKPETEAKKSISLVNVILEGDGTYYTDLSKKIVYNDKIFENKHIIVKYNIPELKWKITNETKVIKGYKATKATARYKFEKENGKQVYREAVAWFSEEIPIKIAPKQFYGLPSAVILLQEGGATYVLESIKGKKVIVDYKVNEKRSSQKMNI